MEPEFSAAHLTRGLAYEQTSRYDEAIGAFEKARAKSGGNPATLAALGHVLASAGRQDEAVVLLNQLRDLSRQRYVSAIWPALVHAGLGEHELAIDDLEIAYGERDFWLLWLGREPRFDCLRSQQKFQDLLERIGLQRRSVNGGAAPLA
jgi:tetratricopeptide (TPR) repeat protein